MNDWNPEQYLKFKNEREKPYADLIAGVRGRRFARVLDVGCGTGNLTAKLADEFGAARVLGVDPSASMLERARAANADPRLEYVHGRFEDFPETERFDLILSNAAIQWMPDHPAVFAKLRRLLAPGGALLVQMPHNYGEPSHRLAHETACEFPEIDPTEAHAVEPLTVYARLLFEQGFTDIDVREKVYLHPMESATKIADWTRGTFLTEFEKQLTPERFREFVARYEARLTALYGPGPCLFLFRRFLLGAALPAA